MTSLFRPRLLAIALLLAIGLVLAVPVGGAVASAAEDVAEPKRTTSFVAATTPTTIPGGPLLLSAYAIVWLGLFGYLFSVRRRQVEVEDELRELLVDVRQLRAAVVAAEDRASVDDPGPA